MLFVVVYYTYIETRQGADWPLPDRIGIDNMTYKTGSIRKNASKKIAALLELATHIEYNHYSFDMMSDCYTYDDARQVSAEFVIKFIADNYSKIETIRLVCDDEGQPVELYVSAFRGYFNITFAPVQVEEIEVVKKEEKPRMSYAAVKAFIESGFISPLNRSDRVESESLPVEEKVAVNTESDFYHFTKTMIEEKGRELDDEISLPGHFGYTYGMLLKSLDSMPEYRNQIKSNLSKIDFKNGNIFHFLDYLARGVTGELVIN